MHHPQDRQLGGKQLVVVGAGSGIGRSLAISAAAAGASVALVGRRREPLEATAAALRAPHSLHIADVTIEAEVAALIESIGAFDHLACTATETAPGRVADVPLAGVERAIATKLWAPLFLVRYGVRHIAPHGSFTFFSGIRGARPAAGSSITSLVNGGLEAFARAMAVELGPIRVNVVSPGIVDSGPFWERLGADGRARMFDDYAARAPARRVGTPEDLAAAGLFAITNPFVTGTVLAVDGGGLLV